MQITDLIQGSAEWHAHRANHFNASDAPAMLGESKYTTRDQLLHQKSTGITKEVDAGTQKAFDNGHKFESLARPIAEKIIGMELYPVTGTNGKYSASFDGITMDESIIMEHKTINDELRAVFADIQTRAPEYRDNSGDLLPIMYRIQMEQQLMVSGAEKCLFMASKWDGETLVEELHCWYHPDLELRQRIVDGWAQFEKDLANYKVPEVKEVVMADVVEALPAPSIVAKGSLVASNLDAITPQFDKYLAETPRNGFKTDLDFANAEANGKNARKMAKTLDDTCEAVIAQQSDINQAITIMRKYAKEFNALGLALEKAVEAEKKAIKTNSIVAAKQKYTEHVSALQMQIVGVTLHQKLTPPDFDGAIKGVRNNDSMHARINEALNAGILDATTLARDVSTKLAYLDEATKGYEGLFADKQSFIFGDMEYIKLLVKTRIDAQKAKDAEREAQIKAKAEAEAQARAEKEKLEALQAKQQPVNEVKPQVSQSEPKSIEASTQDQAAQRASNLTLPPQLEAEFGKVFEPTRTTPSANQIVEVVARHFGVDKTTAHKWLIDTDFAMLMAA